jgi:lysophospholipase L1-like esterase
MTIPPRRLPLLLGLLVLASTACPGLRAADADRQVVGAGDARFRYGGRIDFRDPASPDLVWQASTVALDFTGDRLAVRLAGVQGQVFLNATVDGATVVLDPPDGGPTQEIPVAVSGPGPHHLVLFKRTEASAGTAHFAGVAIAAGARASRPSAVPARLRMEIYGDSITAGACDEDGPQDQWADRRTHNAARSWAADTAAAVGADYRNIAVSGIGVADGYADVLMGQVWDRIAPAADAPKADLTAWTPDVVLVLLGQNDDGHPRVHGQPFPAAFVANYIALVRALRSAYPHAHVVLLNGGMWAGVNSPDLGPAWGRAVAQLEAGDPAISHFTFRHWTNNHPRVADHQAMADELVAWLGPQPFMAPPR